LLSSWARPLALKATVEAGPWLKMRIMRIIRVTHESSKPHCVPACTQVSHVSVLLQPSTADVDDAAGS
jgi:hypothetical protein